MDRLLQPAIALPQVTLVAVTSVNVPATIDAIEASMRQAKFGAVKMLSDSRPNRHPDGMEWVEIHPIKSSVEYSNFLLNHLADYVKTPHVLIVQWDGYVIDGQRWSPEFLEYDYIGASWPHFSDGHDVGNGGFSLRSSALLEACRHPSFVASHPEDVAICRHNRSRLGEFGLRFAPSSVAEQFSVERSGYPTASFGYHGVWHMPRVLGSDAFWQLYSKLDELTAFRRDFISILWQVFRGRKGLSRAVRLVRDQVLSGFKPRKPRKAGDRPLR